MYKFTYKIFLFFAVIITTNLFAQQEIISAHKISTSIKIDGKANEAAWLQAMAIGNFDKIFNADSGKAIALTQVKVLYSEDFLYVFANLQNPPGIHNNYRISTLQRDFPFFENDLFGMAINPNGDKRTGYVFNVSAAGVQNESQVFSGDGIDITWKEKWFSAVSKNADGWSVEIGIPFRILSVNSNAQNWNINFYRIDNRIHEYSAWIFIPRNLLIGSLAYTGSLQFDGMQGKSKNHLTLIPSLTSVLQKDFAGNSKSVFKVHPSLDVKYNLGSSLKLNATINPDFSQVELDQLRTNLTRFELYYPERREFFTEDNNLFTNFGNDGYFTSDSRPFYTRQIGLYYNKKTGAYDETPIVEGVKLSGDISPSTRIGLLNAETGLVQNFYGNDSSLPSQNYTVAVAQQKIFGRSTLSGIFVNRQSTGSASAGKTLFNADDYNRVAGLDFNYLSKNGKWFGNVYHHTSYTSGIAHIGYDKNQNTHGSFLRYTSKQWYLFAGHTYVGKDYNPEVGFVPRKDFLNFRASGLRFFYPKHEQKNYDRLYAGFFYNIFLNPQQHTTDESLAVTATAEYKDQSYWAFTLYNNYTKLLNDFNPSFKGDTSLKAGEIFRYTNFSLERSTDPTKNFSFYGNINGGQYYNGHKEELIFNGNYKIQPKAIFSLVASVTNINLPQPFTNNTIYTAGPRVVFSFSRKLSLLSEVRYNSLSENLNYYSRIGWQFKSLSYLYLVYQDNYDTKNFSIRNRGFAIKINWWL